MTTWERVLKITFTNHGTCYRFNGYECWKIFMFCRGRIIIRLLRSTWRNKKQHVSFALVQQCDFLVHWPLFPQRPKRKVIYIPRILDLNVSSVKFIYSEKATKFCKISTLLLFYVVPKVEILQNFVSFSEFTNFTCVKIVMKKKIE